jgi:hypothetical protein
MEANGALKWPPDNCLVCGKKLSGNSVPVGENEIRCLNEIIPRQLAAGTAYTSERTM